VLPLLCVSRTSTPPVAPAPATTSHIKHLLKDLQYPYLYPNTHQKLIFNDTIHALCVLPPRRPPENIHPHALPPSLPSSFPSLSTHPPPLHRRQPLAHLKDLDKQHAIYQIGTHVLGVREFREDVLAVDVDDRLVWVVATAAAAAAAASGVALNGNGENAGVVEGEVDVCLLWEGGEEGGWRGW